MFHLAASDDVAAGAESLKAGGVAPGSGMYVVLCLPTKTFGVFIFIFVYFLCTCVCVCQGSLVKVRRQLWDLGESILSFPHGGPCLLPTWGSQS